MSFTIGALLITTPYLRGRTWLIVALLFVCSATVAAAHTSSQAFVLLLPTDVYIRSGVAAVALTIALFAVPGLGGVLSRSPSVALCSAPKPQLSTITSLGSLALLLFLIAVGLSGSRDPLANPLPLVIWTVWWIGFVTCQALLGNLWFWVNPWTGLHTVIFGPTRSRSLMELPPWLGHWPALFGFGLFAFFMLADPAPEDPSRLARVVALYWLLTSAGMVVFGAQSWLSRCEFITVMLGFLSRMSLFGAHDGSLRVGLPGWQLTTGPVPTATGAVFVIVMLGTNSFDGLNETFWWLGFLGINPLEFPGRSAVVWQTIFGVIGANLALIAIFAGCVFAGLAMINKTDTFETAFRRLALTLLPIAIGYHIAHFLPTFLVNIQYAVAAVNDPWATGVDTFGLGTFYVTTGFFNSMETVRIIFLTQAAVVVAGHILSVQSAHAVAVGLFGDNRRSVLSQVPLALFMIAYTLFGLWLLATPRGA